MFNRKRRQRNAKIQIQIWEQTNGEVTHFVAGGSTGGTISGVGVWKISWLKQMMMMRVMFVWWKQTFAGKFLKSKNPLVKCVLADPEGSIFYDFFTSRKVLTYQFLTSKKVVKPEKFLVEGVGKGSIPGCMDFTLIDQVILPDHVEVSHQALVES